MKNHFPKKWMCRFQWLLDSISDFQGVYHFLEFFRTEQLQSEDGCKGKIICFTFFPLLDHSATQSFYPFYGRIHLVHLRIRKYLMDDSSVNFYDKFFLHFLLNFRKKMMKKLVMEIYGWVVSKALTDLWVDQVKSASM